TPVLLVRRVCSSAAKIERRGLSLAPTNVTPQCTAVFKPLGNAAPKRFSPTSSRARPPTHGGQALPLVWVGRKSGGGRCCGRSAASFVLCPSVDLHQGATDGQYWTLL